MSLLHKLTEGVDLSQGLYRQGQGVTIVLFLFVGLLKCAALTSRLVLFIWRHYLRPARDLKKYGQWAVVTGATDGIGREYCNALAKQGLNVYLISRTESKLAAAAEEVQSNYNVETKYFVADLAAAGDPGDAGACWFGLRSNLEGLDVGVLVNNAGMSYEHPDFLHSLEEPMLSALLAINAASLTKMCHLVVPGMKERGRGCIVNISSGVSAALPACPLLSVYAATKAYVDTLSASLAAEYAHFGVKVQVQAPAFVATKMAKMRRTSLLVPSAARWVASAVRHVGYEAKAFPYPPHAMLSGSLSSMPAAFVTSYWLNMSYKMRSRALKKKGAAAKGQ